MAVRVIHGDMLEVLGKMVADGERVHAVVTDPPYGLQFMGRKWDAPENVAFRPGTWRLCWELLPPGGHLLAFGGTRTYHRLATAIEEAGFEIRDTLLWITGQGFPKSLDVGKKLDAEEKRCSCVATVRDVRANMGAAQSVSGGAEQNVRAGMRNSGGVAGKQRAACDADNSLRDVREVGAPTAFASAPTDGNLLRSQLQEQDLRASPSASCGERPRQEAPRQRTSGSSQSGVEGRSDVSQAAGQLRKRALRPLPAGSADDGEGGRLCDGAPAGDGSLDRSASDANGDSASYRPQAVEQRTEQPRIVAGQSESQAGGAWPLCGRCGKPIIPDGLGTALKPAAEMICLARKPLVGTVAANVQAHGTGALNIDGCRIATTDALGGGDQSAFTKAKPDGWDRPWMHDEEAKAAHAARVNSNVARAEALGRWPANLVHDGSEEVVRAFPDQTSGGTPPSRARDKTRHTYGAFDGQENPNGIGSTSGNASRFFYSAKADSDDRLGSKHPTVKPVDLIRWLVRLITPPGGLVLDPFAGSGTTGMACMAEGFDCILVEREAEYVADIKRRIAHVSGHDMPLLQRVSA